MNAVARAVSDRLGYLRGRVIVVTEKLRFTATEHSRIERELISTTQEIQELQQFLDRESEAR